MNGAARARAEWVEQVVRERCFTAPAANTLTIGAELELLAFDASTHAIAPIFPGRDGRGSIDVARDVGRRLSWRETISDKGVPRFASDAGGSLTFEPGGQLEYASAVHGSVDGVLRELCIVESRLRESAEMRGICLLAVGVDPFNGPDAAPLQLTADRYERMARYFAGSGPDGARMMRQTASLQVNIGGVPPLERWAVANAIAPWVVALFANSSRYADAETRCASYRAETWRGVDPSRTGVFRGRDPVREYTSFALGARAFLVDDAAPPFAGLDAAFATEPALATHLTTLFPEVRPRGYLELRSLDALDDSGRRGAMAFMAGIVADAQAAVEALELLGESDASLLLIAGRDGMAADAIAAKSAGLVEIALGGCRRLGADIVSEETVSQLSTCVAVASGNALRTTSAH